MYVILQIFLSACVRTSQVCRSNSDLLANFDFYGLILRFEKRLGLVLC